MTHADYLEQHHELSNAGLTEVGLMLAAERYTDATTATTNLRAMLDALYDQRMISAGQGIQ